MNVKLSVWPPTCPSPVYLGYHGILGAYIFGSEESFYPKFSYESFVDHALQILASWLK
jgi:hypothetical protein